MYSDFKKNIPLKLQEYLYFVNRIAKHQSFMFNLYMYIRMSYHFDTLCGINK